MVLSVLFGIELRLNSVLNFYVDNGIVLGKVINENF